MNQRTIRIFLSSEMSGLKHLRKEVLNFIEKRFPEIEVVCSENYSPLFISTNPIYSCLKAIEECDVYLGLFWRRAGFITEHNFFITELEYFYASSKFMPMLIYILNSEENFGYTTTKKEDGLSSFLDLIQNTNDNKFCFNIPIGTNLFLNIEKSIENLRTLSFSNYKKHLILGDQLTFPHHSLEKRFIDERFNRKRDWRLDEYADAYETMIKKFQTDGLDRYHNLIMEYGDIMFYIKENFLGYGFLKTLNAGKRDILNISAKFLIAFSKCFNWMNFTDGSLWCVRTANRLFRYSRNWNEYYDSFYYLLIPYYVRASQLKIDMLSSSHRIGNALQTNYQITNKHLSIISSFMLSHTRDSKFGDGAYSAFIEREKGNFTKAISVFKDYIDYLDYNQQYDLRIETELLYTLSLDLKNNKKEFSSLFSKLEALLISEKNNFLIQRKYAQILINIGAKREGITSMKELHKNAINNGLYDQAKKIKYLLKDLNESDLY